jgi:hypothetical protein
MPLPEPRKGETQGDAEANKTLAEIYRAHGLNWEERLRQLMAEEEENTEGEEAADAAP